MSFATSENNYNITRYLHSPGIHYEHIGYTKLYNLEIQLLTYIDLGSIQNRLDIIMAANEKTIKLCEPENVKILCTNFKVILDQSLPIVQSQVEEIFSLVGHEPKPRTKRAWFDGIGKVSKVLFGTMDAEDATFYSEKIAKFEKIEGSLADLIKGQSKIVKSTISNFNATIRNLDHNENILIKNIEKLEKIIKANENHLLQRDFHIQLQEHLIFYEFLFIQFQLQMNSISQACVLAQKGIIHSSILPQEKF